MNDTEPTWFKSSHSGTQGDNCVEVAISDHVVLVRDSKDADGPHLTVSRDMWSQFVQFATAHS